MFPYVTESFSDDEARVLARYVTNLEGPVFALVNLPEVVKGALFARYSRSSKSLRRLLLDEFADDLPVDAPVVVDPDRPATHAAGLYERVLADYGDDSVAQLGGVHLACEQASNLLTKILERPRLGAYLEQSTRYIPYDTRLSTGWYRYYRDPEVLASPLGARYVAEMDRLFDRYGELFGRLQSDLLARHPFDGEGSELAWRRSVRAAALDAARGVLPAGTLSNVGIYASGQTYEQLLLRMRVNPLPEARRYAGLMLDELRKVIPAFLTRLDRPDRGGEWSAYLEETRDATSVLVERLAEETVTPATSVTLSAFDPAGEDDVLAGIVYAYGRCSDAEAVATVARMDAETRRSLLAAYIGDRQNRRHRPGRALERTSYRFDIVADYGGFRDLQRHRMCTVEWQPLAPDLGYEVPESVAEAGAGALFSEALDASAALHDALAPGFPAQAPYALGMAHRIRFSIQMNAREALHLIELRSSAQGHPGYRAIALEMRRLIATVAGHAALADAMRFADPSPGGLGRRAAEQRSEDRHPASRPAS
jgi:thymidylate synthase ThyX